MATVREKRIDSLLARAHKKTLDVYDKAFPDKPAPEPFWEALARLELRLLETKGGAAELKAAEMAYHRGLKRVCRDQQA